MRGERITAGESFLATPSALTIWTLGTGVLGGLASIILTRRAEKAGWSKFKAGSVIGGVIVASFLNILIASKMEGK